MDDITDKITDLLNDPDGMARISEIASSLLGKGSVLPQSKPTSVLPQSSELPFDPKLMGNMMKVMSALKDKSAVEDNNLKLLLALKPHLSPEKQKKVDKAVSLLKVVKLLPVLKSSGMLDFFGG